MSIVHKFVTLKNLEFVSLIFISRSCKFDINLSQDALNMLKAYLAKHGHVLLIQVLQTWFHIDVNGENCKNNAVSLLYYNYKLLPFI